MGFCQEINGEILVFFFLHYSVTYNVKFTKIICISMSHRLYVFFLFHEIQFSCIKNKLKLRIIAIFLYPFLLTITFYGLYD